MEPGKFDQVKVTAEEGMLRASQALSSMPKWQRFALVLFLIGIFPGYFVVRYGAGAVAENLYKKYLVDARPSFSNPRAVGSDTVSIISISSGEYAAYVRITNPNFELTLPESRYEIKFFNSKNEQVATSRGSYFLLPAQSKYIVIPRIQTKERISKGIITFDEQNWQRRTDLPSVQLRPSDVARTNQLSPQAFVAEGDVFNDSPYRLKRVSITLLLYNSNNKVIAASTRDEFDVLPRSRRAYKLTWPGVFSSDVSRVEVQAETNTTDDTNLRVEASGPGSTLERPEEDQ